MAKLGPYFGPHNGGRKVYLGIFQVGSGSFPDFTDFQVQFAGSYSALGHSGLFKLGLSLTDQNTASLSGPCQATLNDQTDTAATYQVTGQKLVVTTALNDTPLEIYRSQNGTQVDNISNHNIWIG
jgi:hypothetical protein